MFLPVTPQEIKALNWDRPDVIIVTGDTYIDSPYIGAAVIGRTLTAAGYKVALIAQPDVESERDITRLGEPRLFWGVTAGSVDSLVANYTATGKHRNQDDYTPGEVNDRRPDRASLVYTNLIRRYFKNTVPIVLGGIEAGLRRIAHYDFKTDKIRKSILFNAKADMILYGMADRSAVELAAHLSDGTDWRSMRGLCYMAKNRDEIEAETYVELPDYERVTADPDAFIEMFHIWYKNNDPYTAKTLIQRQDTRYLVQNPPALPLTEAELDAVHELDYEYDVHPYYKRQGRVRAMDTIKHSIISHRGCVGECHFCAIALHQGRLVRSRSEASILREAKRLADQPDFKGYIQDVGGPTANMYRSDCRKTPGRHCANRKCVAPDLCPHYEPAHDKQIELLRKIAKIPGVKKVFVQSGIRFDLITGDSRFGDAYLEELTRYHVSGQLKIAPEHTERSVLRLMGKPEDSTDLVKFKRKFDEMNRRFDRRQFLTYYFIAAHPGSGTSDTEALRQFCVSQLRIHPEQVQIFTPTPGTYSSLMYATGKNPFTGEPLFVEKDRRRKEQLKSLLTPSKGSLLHTNMRKRGK